MYGGTCARLRLRDAGGRPGDVCQVLQVELVAARQDLQAEHACWICQSLSHLTIMRQYAHCGLGAGLPEKDREATPQVALGVLWLQQNVATGTDLVADGAQQRGGLRRWRDRLTIAPQQQAQRLHMAFWQNNGRSSHAWRPRARDCSHTKLRSV